jgi:hypothetical protein
MVQDAPKMSLGEKLKGRFAALFWCTPYDSSSNFGSTPRNDSHMVVLLYWVDVWGLGGANLKRLHSPI